MDSIEYYENEKFVGRTNFKSGLLNNYIVMAVKDVDGVARMGHLVGKLFYKKYLNRNFKQGVHATFDFDGTVIDVAIWVKYGYSAADVSYRVQESIINAVSGLIEGKVKNVNVRISGVEYGIQPKKIA